MHTTYWINILHTTECLNEYNRDNVQYRLNDNDRGILLIQYLLYVLHEWMLLLIGTVHVCISNFISNKRKWNELLHRFCYKTFSNNQKILFFTPPFYCNRYVYVCLQSKLELLIAYFLLQSLMLLNVIYSLLLVIASLSTTTHFYAFYQKHEVWFYASRKLTFTAISRGWNTNHRLSDPRISTLLLSLCCDVFHFDV